MKETDSILPLLRDLPIASFAVDGRQRILYLNKAAENATGFAQRNVIGRRCFEVFRCRDSFGHLFCKLRCELQRGAGKGKNAPLDLNFTGRRKWGGRWLEITPMVLEKEKDGPVIVHFINDLRQLKALEKFHEKLLCLILPMARQGQGKSSSDFSPLTSRELEVLKLVVSGVKTGEIAERLYISPHTVRRHLHSLLTKLGVKSRLDAALVALRNGLAR
ncbi:MAG: PAS domain S-box protein [Deltaproteobacteria bacterium]|nr:PAS domain S-box protein [Deltaproteobacteria bacterium]